MSQLRENIVFEKGDFYRVERWNGDDRYVRIIRAPSAINRIPAFGARWHYHRAIEFTFVLRGTSTCFVADRLQKFSSGEIFVLGENIPHYWHHPRGSEGISILLEFPADHDIWQFNEIKPLRLLAERALRGLGVGGRSGKLGCRQIEELVDMDGLRRLGGLFQLLHGLLYAEPADIRQAAAKPFDLTGVNVREEAIRRAQSYLHANHREEIDLADLLDLTGMSRTTFTRLFLRYSGECFTAHLNKVRLQAVCEDLLNTGKTVSCIALDHGFNQLSFFNRIFRREFGVSPTVYRIDHAGSPPVAAER